MKLLIGLVSISDRAAAGIYEDKGIPGLTDWFKAALKTDWRMETRLIPDEQPIIERALIDLHDVVKVMLRSELPHGGVWPQHERALALLRDHVDPEDE